MLVIFLIIIKATEPFLQNQFDDSVAKTDHTIIHSNWPIGQLPFCTFGPKNYNKYIFHKILFLLIETAEESSKATKSLKSKA